jgi:hypothetical protein
MNFYVFGTHWITAQGVPKTGSLMKIFIFGVAVLPNSFLQKWNKIRNKTNNGLCTTHITIYYGIKP